MKNFEWSIFWALMLGGVLGVGFLLLGNAIWSAVTEDQEDTATVTEMHDHSSHSHDPVVAGEPMTLELETAYDEVGGVNLRLVTTGFTWAPENVNQDPVLGEGHAHLYVDGEKVGRIYGEWYHVKLEPGERVVMVELNDNLHRPYMWDGEMVAVSMPMLVPEVDM